MGQYSDDMTGWMRSVEKRLERLTVRGSGPRMARVSPLSLESGWSNYGGAWQKPGWSRLPSGLVVLTGLVAYSGASTSNSTIAILPAGSRPAGGLHFATVGSFGGDKLGIIQIQPTGTVDFRQPSNPSFSSIGWVTLDGVSFLAEQ